MSANRFDWDAIDAELRGRPERVELDDRAKARIERFAADLAGGRVDRETHRLTVAPSPPAEGEIDELETLDPAARRSYTERGREAFARGEFAVAVLNGGMATRFGGAVKGVVDAVGGRAFLEIKRDQARAAGGLPLLVMNSFATHAATLDFLRERGLEEGVHPFLQSVSLRLTPGGELFRDDGGALSPYAPGHGDLGEALVASGLLAWLRERGVRAIGLSNVDNLGAEPDPTIVGYHLEHPVEMTAEVARAIPGDVGGAPVYVNGRLQVLEGFRFPRDFAFDRLPFVNTNSSILSLDALGADIPLSWFYVEKEVEGRTAVQMERLVGEISAFVPTAYLSVPRSGPLGRYYPVKTVEDLDSLRADPALVARFSRGA